MNRKKSSNALEAVKKAGASLEHGGLHSRTVVDIQRKTISAPPVTPIDSAPSERTKIVMRRFATVCIAKGVDALVQEFNDLKVSCPTANQLNHATFDKHPEKNRYKDIICVEDNRVKLIWPPGTTSDYIHANLIKGLPDMDKQVICTQGPTKDTVEDFWRMIWQEKSSAIIMLCSVMENGKKKCEQYWPEKQGQTMNVANLSIQNTGVEIVGKDLKYTKLIVSGIGSDGGVRKHTVNHVLWSEWPDKGVPLTSTGALRLIFRTQTFSPSVVHCSAGVGRTGTIVALECCMRVLNAGNELSVYNVVKILRSQRFLACQTDLQYLYVHR
ncbi:hypothetical protein M3Y94_00802400 [Aphelenchoides besseyi]|nr:hypothetical protein M3Y94_00802400 [Aphelenchoides besseyi]